MSFLNEDRVSITAETRERLLHHPFEHTIIDSQNPTFGKEGPVVFNTFGCPEYNDPSEIKKVGHLAKKIGQEAVFSLLLGDNNNKTGVTEKNSSEFKTLFHDVHEAVTFVILGNHDQPTLKTSVTGQSIREVLQEAKDPDSKIIETYKFNEDAILAQILHTFVDPVTGNWDDHKIKCWDPEAKAVDLAKLRDSKNNWNMPGRYGVLHCGHSDFFAIDSTRFIADFINYFLLKIDKEPNNQAAWFFRAVKQSKAVHKIVLSHHPFHDISKRNVCSDHPEYLTESQIKVLEEFGISGNYNAMLNQIMFLTENLEKGIPSGPGHLITEAQTAHHHAIHYIKPEPSRRIQQWVSGGAGGPKQPRHRFTEYEDVLYHSMDHGFVQSSLFVDGSSSAIVNTLQGNRVQIADGKIKKDPRESNIVYLEKTFIAACRKFQALLCKEPLFNVSPELSLQPTYRGTGKAIDWVPNFYELSDEIQNFLNRVNPHTQEEIENFMKETLKKAAKDPAEQYYESRYWGRNRYWGERIFIHEPPDYLPKLKEHHDQWKKIFENCLVNVFGMKYDEYIQANTIPVAKFFDQEETPKEHKSQLRDINETFPNAKPYLQVKKIPSSTSLLSRRLSKRPPTKLNLTKSTERFKTCDIPKAIELTTPLPPESKSITKSQVSSTPTKEQTPKSFSNKIMSYLFGGSSSPASNRSPISIHSHSSNHSQDSITADSLQRTLSDTAPKKPMHQKSNPIPIKDGQLHKHHSQKRPDVPCSLEARMRTELDETELAFKKTLSVSV